MKSGTILGKASRKTTDGGNSITYTPYALGKALYRNMAQVEGFRLE
jgi:hypothetical protein